MVELVRGEMPWESQPLRTHERTHQGTRKMPVVEVMIRLRILEKCAQFWLHVHNGVVAQNDSRQFERGGGVVESAARQTIMDRNMPYPAPGTWVQVPTMRAQPPA
jgi:hypothetical protein